MGKTKWLLMCLLCLAAQARDAWAQQDSIPVWTVTLGMASLPERVAAGSHLSQFDPATLPPETQSAVVAELRRLNDLLASQSPIPGSDDLADEDLASYYVNLTVMASQFRTEEADLALVPAIEVGLGIQKIVAQLGDAAVPELEAMLARGESVASTIETFGLMWFWADSTGAPLSEESRHSVVQALFEGVESEDFGVAITTAVALGELKDPAFLPLAEHFYETKAGEPTIQRIVALKAVGPLEVSWESAPLTTVAARLRRLAEAVCVGASGGRLASCQSVLAELGEASDRLALNDSVGGAAALAAAADLSASAVTSGAFSSADNLLVGSSAWFALQRIAVVTPTVLIQGPTAAIEGQDLVFDGSASLDHYGTSLSFRWEYGDGAGSDGPGGEHAYADNGTYSVTLTVTNAYDLASTASTLVEVGNADPANSSVDAPLPTAVGLAVSAGGEFFDPGIEDAHSVMLDWGDGETAPAVVVESGGAGTYHGTHNYQSTGVYQVTATIADDDGGSVDVVLGFAPAYDPAGAFVTGGGWIDSPAGAYSLDPAVTGKANFGFVSRYKQGSQNPEGETQFRLHSGPTFHSDAYEWLVVDGPKATFQGTGSVDGAPGYGFTLTMLDGDEPGGGGVDRFRMEIWELGTGQVLYDSQPGAADAADPSTLLGGGQIKIHH